MGQEAEGEDRGEVGKERGCMMNDEDGMGAWRLGTIDVLSLARTLADALSTHCPY